MRKLDVLSVVSEIYPLIKTGGLADVAGALPGALLPHGIRVRTLVPGYPKVMQALDKATVARAIPDLFGGKARLLRADAAGLELYVLDAPHLYAREGSPYAAPGGVEFPDNAFRFAALGRIGAAVAQGMVPRYRPHLVHTHDWQAGLTAAYLDWSGEPKPPLVTTIHNLAFQGQFDPLLLPRLGLPPAAFTADGVEYYGDIGFLKAAVRLADRITTVSPTYAAEICTEEGGMGMGGLLRGRSDRLVGILNGIDTEVWNPTTDDRLHATYSAQDLSGRAANKAALQTKLHLEMKPDAPLFGVVSRLDWQKGLDLLLEALPALAAEGAQLALLGSGDPRLEAGFREAMAAFPGQVGCAFVYDENLAHLIQGGADAIVMPSRFEPCGLTQLCALRYGAVPVVARVGGLSDTVIDASPMGLASGAATGVQFALVQTPLLERALRQAVALYRRPDVWRRLQANGMATDVSWTEPARRYAALYADLVPAA